MSGGFNDSPDVSCDSEEDRGERPDPPCRHCEHGTVYVQRDADRWDSYPCDGCGPFRDDGADGEIDRRRDDRGFDGIPEARR